jgi:hypothetical protein
MRLAWRGSNLFPTTESITDEKNLSNNLLARAHGMFDLHEQQGTCFSFAVNSSSSSPLFLNGYSTPCQL